MEASVIVGWSDFLVASASAAAALAGLLFVAISINLTRIIEIPGLSGRAAETIILLSCALAISLIPLIPRLSAATLGIALLIPAIPAWIAPIVIHVRSIKGHTYVRPAHIIVRAVLHQSATLPAVLAGFSLCGVLPGGMFWLAGGIIASMLVAIANSWVLQVEILR